MISLSLNDLLGLFGDTLSGITGLDLFLWFVGSVAVSSAVGCFFWLVRGKRL